MPNENKFFIDSETEVKLQGVRDENGDLLDGTAEITGSIARAGHISFTYDGSGGNFTGVIPPEAKLDFGKEYTLKVRIKPASGRMFTVGITRRAEFISL